MLGIFILARMVWHDWMFQGLTLVYLRFWDCGYSAYFFILCRIFLSGEKNCFIYSYI